MTSWTAAHQASLSITNSRSLLKLMSIESVLPSNHLILCRPLLLLPFIFPSVRVFSSESVLHIRWPKYWSFSFSISPFNEYSGLISRWTGWISVQSKGLSRIFSNTTVQKHQFFGTQLSLQSNSPNLSLPPSYSINPHLLSWASLIAQLVKNLPVMQETPIRFLGREDLLEKGKATPSSILGLPWWLSW